MIKEFEKYDKEAQRTVYIKTEIFNKILAEANAAVRVIPRDVDVHNSYVSYEKFCEAKGETPMSEFEFDRTYFCHSCSFELYENAPVPSSTLLISKALGIKAVDVKYAKDYYGRITDDELEVTYHIA